MITVRLDSGEAGAVGLPSCQAALEAFREHGDARTAA